MAWVLGMGVVMVSFVITPIGAGAAVIGLRRVRRQGASQPRRGVVALGLNLFFLVVAITLWFWIRWLATRRSPTGRRDPSRFRLGATELDTLQS